MTGLCNAFRARCWSRFWRWRAPNSCPRRSNKDKDDPTVRSLQGQVADPDDKPVAGGVVQLKDTRTLQVRSFITEANGDYRFSGLRADTDYEVKAEYNGMSSDNKRLSNFDSRKIATDQSEVEQEN